MGAETVGEAAHLFTAAHPPRTDSPEYHRSRKWLMNQAKGGCMVCGGVPDLTHPDTATTGNPHGQQDHHGGGIYHHNILIGLNLFGLEWSLGWSADPVVVAAHVANLNVVLAELGEATYDAPITTTAQVMDWIDSAHNANVRICAAHHIGRMDKPSKDANGHEAVGVHEIPFPIWLGQITCDWSVWDMWAGTSGTLAVAPDPVSGGAVVLHAHPAHHPGLAVGAVLAPDHPHVMRARIAPAAA